MHIWGLITGNVNCCCPFKFNSKSKSMKNALITGGSGGIGYGVAKALLQEGYRVMITGRNPEKLDLAVHSLSNGSKDQILGRVCDVRDLQAQQRTVSDLLAEFGSLDVLVANAGIGHFAPVDQLTIEQWQETIDTNLTGVFYSLHASLPALKSSKGYVFTISSLAGTNFFAAGSAYNASKFGLTGFTQAVMLDLRKYGIRVATIMPGSVATDFSAVRSEDESWKIQPEDIGQMIADLLKLNPRTLPSKVEVRPTLPR